MSDEPALLGYNTYDMSPFARLLVTPMEDRRGFHLAGELDMSTAAHLSTVLDPELAVGGDVTLELTDLTFMDSTGLQVLIRSALSMRERGRLILFRPDSLVRSILELAIRTDKIPNLVVDLGE